MPDALNKHDQATRAFMVAELASRKAFALSIRAAADACDATPPPLPGGELPPHQYIAHAAKIGAALRGVADDMDAASATAARILERGARDQVNERASVWLDGILTELRDGSWGERL